MVLSGLIRTLLRPALLVAAAVGALCCAPAALRAADPVVTVTSLNPDSGVLITPCCGMNACAQFVQETPFTISCPGGTPVRLDAPATFGEIPFTEWRRPGHLAYTLSPTFIFPPDTNVTLTVVYGDPVEPLPDFVVTGIALTPASPVAGATFSAQVTVTNQGAAVQLLDASLDLWTDRAEAPGCRISGTTSRSFGSLAPGAGRVLTINGLTAGPAGSATFRAFADSWCLVEEEDETNNQTTLAYTVRPRKILSVTSENPEDAPIAVSPADLFGLAGATAPFSRSYDPGAGVTLTAPADVRGYAFQKWRQDGVDFAGTREAAVTMAADHILTAVYVRPPSPDFQVTGITLMPGEPTAGFAFRSSVTVKNKGDADGFGGKLAVWTNKLTNPACNWDDSSQWLQVGALAAGESKSFVFADLGPLAQGSSYHFRASVDAACETPEGVGFDRDNDNQSTRDYLVIPGGTETLWVDTLDGRPAGIAHTMDVSGQTTGTAPFSRTSRKYALVTLTAPATTPDGGVFQKWTGLEPVVPTTPEVTFTMDAGRSVQAVYVGPGEPDFAVTSLVLDPPDPPAGGTFTATVTIKNVGTGRGVPGTLDLFPDRDTPAGCWAGTIYGPMYIYDLAAGASLTFTVPNIPAGGRGAKRILAFVDSFCGTGEPDEANNQVFVPYEVVNAPPWLDPVGDHAAVEGAELVFTVAPGDPDNDIPLTLKAENLPPGAAFVPLTGIFRWIPGFDQAGRHEGIVFTVTDPSGATTAETIAIEVAEPAGPVFADDFSDPAPAVAAGGDPWLPLAGAWNRANGVYTATSGRLFGLTRVALLDPEALPLGAGIVQARVKLTTAATGSLGPNALVVFGFADLDHYRWVRFTRGKVQIGQTGEIDGIPGGKKRGAVTTLRTGSWYRFGVKIERDGWVRVFKGAGTKPLVAHRFTTAAGTPSVVPGGVGLATSKAKSVFDDVVVWEESVFTPPVAAGEP